MLEIVQVSDSHLFADPSRRLYGSAPWERFQKTLAALRYYHRRARLMVLTGDLAQEGEGQAYAQLKEEVARLGMPVYPVPGNHDDPELMRAVLANGVFRFARCVSVGGWNLIFLDSTLPGQAGGELSERELISLDKNLHERRDQPTAIFLHHPPVPVGVPWLDAISINNPEALFAILDRHLHVKGVLFGHVHHACVAQRNHVQYLGCPSTAVAFATQEEEMVADDSVPPAYRRLLLHADGRLESEVIYASADAYRIVTTQRQREANAATG